MPSIVLWPSLAVTAGFGLLFTVGTVLGVLERLRRTREPGDRPQPLFELVMSTTLAAFCWFSVYRIFNPS